MEPIATTGRATRAAVVGCVAVAAGLRFLPFLSSWRVGPGEQYDDSVMYGAAAALVHGELPYRDVVFLHPPGILLLLSPFASTADTVGDGTALGAARLLVMLLGTINCLLIALLLSRRGTAAVVVGAGAYAVWAPLVSTDRNIFLEPVLTTGLLVALLALRSPRRVPALLAGLALGVALATKYWAVLDLLALGAFIVLGRGRARLPWFVAGAGIGAGAIALPFFLIAPGQMWAQTASTQLGRPSADVPLAARAAFFNPVSGFQGSQDLPANLFLLGLSGLALLALASLGVAIVGRRRPGPGVRAPLGSPATEEACWAVVALVHLGALLVASPAFYFHYAAWAAAPLTLILGGWAGRLATTAVGKVLVAAAVLVLAVAAWSNTRHLDLPPQPPAGLTAWADTHRCVWGPVDELVSADATSSNAAHACGLDVDPFGRGLLVQQAAEITADDDVTTGNPAWRAVTWQQLLSADGVLVTDDPARRWWDEQQQTEFEARYVRVGGADGYSWWDRRR